jgi:hypothetical protein
VQTDQTWKALRLVGDPFAPTWLINYLADDIREMSTKGRSLKPEPLPASRGRQELTWGPLRDRDGREIKAAEALVFAGPAVKDGAASYSRVSSGMVVRIPLSASLTELEDWLRSRELGLTLSMRRDAQMLRSQAFVIEGRFAIPSWVVTPEGLVSATMTAWSMGGQGSCSDSNWMELKLDTDKSPPIWAVLVLPHPGMAKDVVVKRVPNVTPQEGDGVAYRGELEVRWVDNRFEPLRITAKRYDVAFSEYEQAPDGNFVQTRTEPIGSAWKVEVRAKPDGKPYITQQYTAGYVAPLSVTGTPMCAPL